MGENPNPDPPVQMVGYSTVGSGKKISLSEK
jgi:hypothetical protein